MSSTISQQLAEAFQTNTEAATPVPEYLKEFTSVISKQNFNTLPEPKEWDHAVGLIPGFKPSRCKIYPLSPTKQKELDIFLKENWRLAKSNPLNLPCHLQYSSLRKRMVLLGDTLTSSLHGIVHWSSYLDLILSHSPISPHIPAYLCFILI